MTRELILISIFGFSVGWKAQSVSDGTSSRVNDARGEGKHCDANENKQTMHRVYLLQRKSSEYRYSYNAGGVKRAIQSNPIVSTTDEIFTRDDALNGVIAVDDDEMSKGLGEEDVVRSTRGKV